MEGGYPDVADGGETGTQTAKMVVDGERFRLTTRNKFMWQTGWWNQHQRLLQSMSNQKLRPGLVLSGDLHVTGHQNGCEWRPLFRVKSNSFDHYWSSGHRFGMPSRARGLPMQASRIHLDNLAPIDERPDFITGYNPR